jgi:PAS domain S-box-containing protein
MKTNDRSRSVPILISRICACITLIIASIAIMGWAADLRILARVSPQFIPMAPSTAVVFVLLSIAVLAKSLWPTHRTAHWFGWSVSTVVSVVGLLILAQHVGGFDVGMEELLSRTSETFGLVQIARMSPITALVFLLSGLSLFTQIIPSTQWRISQEVSASMATGVAAGGMMVVLAYLHGSPLLHGAGMIPMALTTAIAFVFLGFAQMFGTSPLARSPRNFIPVSIALTVAILLSVAVFDTIEGLTRRNMGAEFDRRAGNLAYILDDGMRDHLTGLTLIGDLFAASQVVERSEFRIFARSLVARPGIKALEWVPRVPAEERRAYEDGAHSEGVEDFRIRGLDLNGRSGLVPAPETQEYYPVYYVEPAEGNEAAMGFDMASDDTLSDVMTKARDTGKMAASPAVILVQDTDKKQGVLIFLPIYRNNSPQTTTEDRRVNLRGFAVGAFRVSDVVEATLLGYQHAEIELVLRDTTEQASTGEGTVLYESARSRGPTVHEMTRFYTLWVADRLWSIEVYPAMAFLASQDTWQTWSVLVIGLMLTTLMGAYLLASTRHSEESKRATAELMEAAEESRRHASETARALESLRSSEERFRSIAETTADAIILADSSGNVIYWNRGAQVIFGYAPEEMIGRSLTEIMPERFRQAHMEGMEQLMAADVSRVVGKTIELVGLRNGGAEFPMEVSVTQWETATGRFFGSILRDITERRKMEEELVTSRKFESSSIIAAGIAHDFNNLLGIIHGNIDLVRMDEGLEENIRGPLDNAARVALQAGRLTKILLTLASGEEPMKAPSTVKDLIDESIRLSMGDDPRDRERCRKAFPDGLWQVEVDRSQVTQAINNVLSNAREVTPQSGTIRIGAENIHVEEGRQEHGLPVRPGRYVKISIQDQGPGIPTENLSKIFDPYYSTKDRGVQKGMGLGLAIAYSVVKRNDGYIRAESRMESGTTIFIYLPALQ